MNTANPKTMAATRKQASITAQNICNALSGSDARDSYNGYGSCRLE